MAEKPICQRIATWLKNNNVSVAGLTTTDWTVRGVRRVGEASTGEGLSSSALDGATRCRLVEMERLL